ncbi:MAG: LuxR family transcriptional regulator [Alphaproteobacteria bacterium]|nr:LuxR family transcriptional regulator [Alphaproteobacteria bacterium]HCP00102.1 LuxR family transcriptional regulator [Rhodospirillaceae bacterium]
MLVDSHCHLDFEDFDDEVDDIVGRARDAGVGTMVSISTHLSRFDGVRAIAERFNDVWCTVGVHPHHAGKEGQDSPSRLVKMAAHPRVVGIGESGLDYYYDRSPRDRQKISFRAHIAAARETGLPLVVHARDADLDTAEILRDEMGKGAFTGVMHCFSSGRGLAEAALELGMYVSFSGILTFKNAQELRDIARDIPEDRLLVETDAPFLAPVPNRGQRNEPSFIVSTAETLATIKGLAAEDLHAHTTENFFRLFSRAERPANL